MSKASTAIYLRLEGLALGLALRLALSFSSEPWWLFAVLFLAPDLSMLGYLAGPRIGAVAYNLVHSWASLVVLVLRSSGILAATVPCPVPAASSSARISDSTARSATG